MHHIDPDKEWRLQRETEMFDSSFVDHLGEALIRFLEERINKELFGQMNGRLNVSIPTIGNPNARVIVPKDKPFEPTIEIRFSLLIEIYKDAFAFPLISNRIRNETDVIQTLNSEMFKEAKFTFDGAVPEISENQIEGPLFGYCAAVAKLVRDHKNSRIEKNDVYCRFLMFEIMVVWTFFHELSHVLQQHHAVRERLEDINAGLEHIDELGIDGPSDISLLGQAREILADAEGIHLTLNYLAENCRLNYATTYLLLCSVSCMFQRFYNSYEDHLEIVSGQHPHPVIRDEFAQVTVLNWVTSYLAKVAQSPNLETAGIPLLYLSTRATLVTGIYRAHRIEKTINGKLPSYMALQSKDHESERRCYMYEIAKHVMQQLPMVRELHLSSASALEPLIKFAEKLTKERREDF